MCTHRDTPKTKTIAYELKTSLAIYRKGNSLAAGTLG